MKTHLKNEFMKIESAHEKRAVTSQGQGNPETTRSWEGMSSGGREVEKNIPSRAYSIFERLVFSLAQVKVYSTISIVLSETKGP